MSRYGLDIMRQRCSNANFGFQGQFFPFFILTLTGLVTLPLTYNLLRPSKGESWQDNASYFLSSNQSL